jgi:hypothetical protein
MFEQSQPTPFEAQAHDVQLTLNTSSEMMIVRSTSTNCHLLHSLTHFVRRLKVNYARGLFEFDRNKLLNLGHGEIAS